MRVHLVQVLVVNVGIGEVKPAEQHRVNETARWDVTSSPVTSRSPQHQVSDVEQVAQECAAVILLTRVHL